MTRQSGERGSALLIVFVFAAAVAIMLYMEMPVAMFEARRQKEQLLIDRANEYKHAVKLYVRKVGTYPPSLDALENTNRMRFLRHRFKDPFTGKDDWRLLHAGPGGMIMDSKVNPIAGFGQNGTGSSFAQNSGLNAGNNNGSNSIFGASSNGGNSSFGANSNSAANSGFGSSGSSSTFGSSSSSEPAVVVSRNFPQRPPAVAASGGGAGDSQPSVPVVDQGSAPPFPAMEPGQGLQAPANPQMDQTPGGTPSPPPVGLPTGQNGNEAAGPGQAGPGGTDQPGQTQANGLQSNGMQPGGSSFANANGRPSQGPQATGGMGVMNSGGIAGVASKAQGQTIKTVNDQTDYSLWEFYYDPRKDTTVTAVPGATPGGAQAFGGQVNQNAQGQSIFNTNSGGNPSGGLNTPGTLNPPGQNPGNPNSPPTPPPIPPNPPQQ